MRKYRKVSDCPKELQLMIDWVNLLPGEAAVESAREELSNLHYHQISETKTEGELEHRFKKLIDNKDFLAYLASEKPFSFSESYGSVSDVFDARPVLLAICKINQKEINEFGKNAFTKKGMSDSDRASSFEKEVEEEFSTSNYKVDSAGRLRQKVTGLGLIFEKYKPPFVRIRLCPVCKKIFWAKRIDAKSCGDKKCSDIISQKEKLSNPQKRAEINEQRRRNYAYKKAVDKENKNGTL